MMLSIPGWLSHSLATYTLFRGEIKGAKGVACGTRLSHLKNATLNFVLN